MCELFRIVLRKSIALLFSVCALKVETNAISDVGSSITQKRYIVPPIKLRYVVVTLKCNNTRYKSEIFQ